MNTFKLLTTVFLSISMLGGCAAPPKTLPTIASGKAITIVDLEDDTLIRVYHAQDAAPAMHRDTVLNTLAVNRVSKFNAEAASVLVDSNTESRDMRKTSLFKEFSEEATKTRLGPVLAIPVSFSVSPYDPESGGYKICIDGICANPYIIKQGFGAYKLNITVTTAKFLTLSYPSGDPKQYELRFDEMGRQGVAVLYAKVDRVSHEARYTPTIYASVFRVALKEKSRYDNPTTSFKFWYTDLANITVGPSP